MQSLREALGEIEDDRAWCEYPLDGILTLMCLALMCGCNHIREIARWGQEHRWELSERLGFRRARMPSEGGLRHLLKRLDLAAFNRIVAQWGEATLKAMGQEEAWQAMAIDGKTLRGSRTDELPAVHLLSALGHKLQAVLGQVEVDSHTNEIKGIVPLLADLTLEGRVVTMDAMLTQRDIARTIVKKGGTT